MAVIDPRGASGPAFASRSIMEADRTVYLHQVQGAVNRLPVTLQDTGIDRRLGTLARMNAS